MRRLNSPRLPQNWLIDLVVLAFIYLKSLTQRFFVIDKARDERVKEHAFSMWLSERRAATQFKHKKIQLNGAIAQLGERLLCTQEVCGSIPHSSTTFSSRTWEWWRKHSLFSRNQKFVVLSWLRPCSPRQQFSDVYRQKFFNKVESKVV